MTKEPKSLDEQIMEEEEKQFKQTHQETEEIERETPRELILFFIAGFKPIEIIKLGYNKTTVYRYKIYYEKALIEFKRKLGIT